MRAVVFIWTLLVLSVPAHALDWICTVSVSKAMPVAPPADTAAATGTARRAIRARKVDRLDLMQAYAGQPVLIGNTWLLAVMLPANHPDSKAAFAQLGLSAEAAERMANGAGLVDRGIRVVQSPAQVVEKLSSNPPAVGYMGFFSGARDVAVCF